MKPAKVIPSSQKRVNAIFGNSLTHDKTVYLRWAPSSPEVLAQAVKYGYKVERFTAESEIQLGNGVLIEGKAIVHVPPADSLWTKKTSQNKNAAFIHQTLFDISGTVKKTDASAAGKKNILFGFALKACEYDFELAKMSALGITDKAALGTAVYRISLWSTDPGFKYEPAIVYADASADTELPAAEDFKVKSGARGITLSWNGTKNSRLYGSYNVERSEDGNLFQKVNKAPVVLVKTQYEKEKTEIAFIDTVKHSSKKYWYRIKGMTFFGFEGNSTNVLAASSKQSLDGYPFIDSSAVVNKSQSAIYFHPSPEVLSAEIKNVLVFRAGKEAGAYQLISALKSSANFYVDTVPAERNFYKIVYDLGDGDSVVSAATFVKIPDIVPPASPIELQGRIDSAGTVKLTWKNNTENDLRGYRVFRSNSLNEEFVEVTKKILLVSEYSEKLPLKNLTEEIYYKITAVDKVFNNSAYTTAVKLKKPDIIPPVAPVVTKLTHTDSTINLEFISSSSADVYKHLIIRKENKSGRGDTVAILRSGEPKQRISDAHPSAGNLYSYEVHAIDDDGNRAVAFGGEIVFQPKYFPAVKEISTRVDRENRFIMIEWNYKANDVYSFLIYKAKKGERMKLIETALPGKQTLVDKEVNVNNIYEYRIKVIFKSGSETKLSAPVEVVY